MGAVYQDKKTGVWFLHFSFEGKQYRRSSGTKNKAAAKALQARVNHKLEEIRLGLLRVPPGRSIDSVVFDDPEPAAEPPPGGAAPAALDAYVSDYLRLHAPPVKAESTCRTELTHLNHLLAFAARQGGKNQSVAALTPRFFNEYKIARARQVRTETVNKELSTYRYLMNCALRDGIIPENPLAKVEWLKSDAYDGRFLSGEELERALADKELAPSDRRRLRRFRYLTPEEIGRLLALVAGTPVDGALRLIAYTGMRLNEARRLAWSDVDIERGEITLRSRKAARRQREKLRQVDIHPDLATWLHQERERRPAARLVLGNDRDEEPNRYALHDRLRSALRGTEFEGIGFHALRHSMATNLAAAGVDERVIDEILGHSTLEMRKRYRHLHPRNRRAAIAVLSFGKPGPRPVPPGSSIDRHARGEGEA